MPAYVYALASCHILRACRLPAGQSDRQQTGSKDSLMLHTFSYCIIASAEGQKM